jgi:AcrR family transcriptional regulator
MSTPENPDPSRRIGRGAQRVPKRKFRESILQAALEVFSEKGFHDAQIGEIAQRAQVAVGTVYNIFSSKTELYNELMLAHTVEILASYTEILEGDQDPLKRIFQYVRAKNEVYEEHQEMVHLFFDVGRSARLSVRAALTDAPRVMYDAMLQRLAEVFDAAISDGLLRPLDPFDLAIGLDGMTNGFGVLEIDHPDQHPYTSKIPTILRVFFGGIVTDEGRAALERELA